jgi:REP element-mobilizing transposase RayT
MSGTRTANPVRMSAPRQVLPGAIYLVTRRCAQRQFLLRPSRVTNDVLLYVLALAAERYRIHVHAFCVLSNHYHLVVSDPDANLPAFQQFLDALAARAVNASLGRWEAFWSPDAYSAVRLLSPSDVVDKAAYTLANPVEAGLVGAGSAWPGLWSAPELIGSDAIVVKRPKHFFDPKGGLPDQVTLRLTLPAGFASAEQFRRQLESALHFREANARSRWRARGGFLGVARVLAQKPMARPRPGEPRRELNPRIAGRDKWKRIEALGRLVDFLRAYRLAWRARRSGAAHVTFPYGTYLLRVLHDVPCDGTG